MLPRARVCPGFRYWSLLPAVLATGLLAAGIGGADHVTRAEKAVAARLSWCGVDEPGAAKEEVRWQGTSTVRGKTASVVAVAHPGGDPEHYTIIASPLPGGGWRVVPADKPTAEALGDCLDRHSPATT